MLKPLALAAAAAMFAAAPASAATNTGFEFGLTGWTANGDAGTTSSISVGNTTLAPTQGQSLGYIGAGLGADMYSTLEQSFHLQAGDVLTGDAAFLAADYLPFNDDAYLSIGGTVLGTASVATVGNYGSTGWLNFSFVAPTTGSYLLQLGVRNVLDNGLSSYAALDNVRVNGALAGVPEPATWALMILGFGAVGGAMRRRRAVTGAAFA